MRSGFIAQLSRREASRDNGTEPSRLVTVTWDEAEMPGGPEERGEGGVEGGSFRG